MTNDIKEILDKLKNKKEETLLAGLRECQLKNIEHVFITKEEYIDKVLDYITNLQYTKEYLGEVLYEKDKELEKLKEQLEYLRTDEYLNQVKWERNFNETMNKELKSRIEKAVEYINYYGTTPEENDDTTCRHILKSLLNILNGKE